MKPQDVLELEARLMRERQRLGTQKTTHKSLRKLADERAATMRLEQLEATVEDQPWWNDPWSP